MRVQQIPAVVIFIIATLLFIPYSSAIRIKTNDDNDAADHYPSSGGIISASPTLIYRRRLNNNDRSSSSSGYQSIYPSPTSPSSNSIEENFKTESEPGQVGDDQIQEISYPPSSSPPPTNTRYSPRIRPSSLLTRPPKKLKGYRRNRSRSRIRTVSPQQAASPSSLEEEQYTQKPSSVGEGGGVSSVSKPKSGRRRKVKRPNNKKRKIVPSSNIDNINVNNNKGSGEEEVVGGGDNNKSTNSSSSGSGDKNLALEIGSEDGKYALIDKFFSDGGNTPSSPPGLLSYAASNDFPRNDNQHTLGNVKQNDIWLSDGHLLVLKGGDLDASLREVWKPIDNYQRGNKPPLRIALDSDNPPPFPVFVNETGPPVFLGPPPPFGLPYPPPGAFNESFDPSRLPPPGMVPLYPNGTIPDYYRPPGGNFGGVNNSLFPQGLPLGQYGQGGYPPGGNFTRLPPPPHFFPFPPPGGNNNRTGGPPPGFYPPLLPPPGFNRTGGGGPPPPGGGYPPFFPPLVLNPNDNETDDPSIFLPPPYDFDYADDNTTIVPPGPFAPGLVVPPPRNFYTVYNKTTKRPTLPPPLGLSYSFGNKRPILQRPNSKKAKFPMTQPPDDSEEAYPPILVTTPYPNPYLLSEIGGGVPPLKKRKQQRPGGGKLLLNKGNFITKYEVDTDMVVNKVISPPIRPLSQEEEEEGPPLPPSLFIPPVITSNTIAPPTLITPSSKPPSSPLNNYVYVRGQLKSLAELNQPGRHEEEGGGDVYRQQFEVTPRPPFDEQGYPTRVLEGNGSGEDEEDRVILQYNSKKQQQQRPTPLPQGKIYYNTNPPIYPGYTTKPKKVLQGAYYNQNGVSPRPTSPSLYLDNNRLSNQNGFIPPIDDNSNALGDNNNLHNYNYDSRIQPYRHHQQQNVIKQKHPIIQLESPKLYPLPGTTTSNSGNNNNRQPHTLYTNTNFGGGLSSGFRPAFGPAQQQQQQPLSQSDRSNKAINQYPGQVRQSGPIFDFQNQNYFQPRPQSQVDGYYSPITQYYQPLQQQQQNNNNNNNNFFPNSQQQPNFFNNGGGNQYQQGGGIQFQSPFFNGVSGIGQSLLNSGYRSPLHQFLPQSQSSHQQQQTSPLHQDAYVNYREPLPQYNTESEAVTTRTVFRAGPSKPPPSVQGKTGVNSKNGGGTSGGGGSGVSPDGSYYSFQRGGPGGFSYKIKL